MANIFTYEGQVHHLGKLQDFDSGFRKRELVCFTNYSYRGQERTKYAIFEFKGDAVSALDLLKTNDRVRVTFELDGRSWKKDDASPVRWFGSVNAFKVERTDQGLLAAAAEPDQKNEAPSVPVVSADDDDIPF